jgi:peptide/nickel transport system permease protein
MKRSHLGPFVLRRLGAMAGILLVLTFMMFVLQRMVPGDPVRASLGKAATEEQVEAERERRGVDDPIPVQYVRYLGDLVHGDLGDSVDSKRPVTTDLGEYIPASLELFAAGLFLAVAGGLALGIVSIKRGVLPGLARGTMLAGAAAPVFLLGLLAILVFYRHLGWLPGAGRRSIVDGPDGPTGLLIVDGVLGGRLDVSVDAFQHLILPAVCLALGPAVAIGRMLRSSLVTDLRSDYVRTARAVGVRESGVVLRHAMRNCLNGTLAMTGLQIGTMFVSLAVVEQVFSWPGLGAYVNRSIAASDLPAIMGFALVAGILYVVVNAVVDILQVVADPRIAAERT